MTLELSPAEVLAASLPSQKMIQDANALAIVRVCVDDLIMRLIKMPDMGRLHPEVSATILRLGTLSRHLTTQEVDISREISRQLREESEAHS